MSGSYSVFDENGHYKPGTYNNGYGAKIGWPTEKYSNHDAGDLDNQSGKKSGGGIGIEYDFFVVFCCVAIFLTTVICVGNPFVCEHKDNKKTENTKNVDKVSHDEKYNKSTLFITSWALNQKIK